MKRGPIVAALSLWLAFAPGAAFAQAQDPGGSIPGATSEARGPRGDPEKNRDGESRNGDTQSTANDGAHPDKTAAQPGGGAQGR